MMYNAHIHLFTIRHVPNNFSGLRIFSVRTVLFVVKRLSWLAWLFIRLAKVIFWLLRIEPQKVSRMLRFVEAGLEETQPQVFERIRYYYPGRTTYIVLPMDMAAMGRGDPMVGIMEQHAELLELRDALAEHNRALPEEDKDAEIVPFGHVDPRRVNALEMFTQLHDEGRGVQGLKIYPSLGYRPDHPRLVEELYPYCAKHNLPVMTHCSSGGVHGVVTGNELDADGYTVKQGRALSVEEAGSYADPENYIEVLQRFPEVRFCLAHLGGLDAWQEYFGKPRSRRPASGDFSDKNWLSKLLEMLPDERFPNLFTDISYTIFYFNDFHRPLKVFLQNPGIRKKVLFGSDFYMTEVERFKESQLSISLRAELGDNWFNEIAQINPQRYLHGQTVRLVRALI